MFSSVFTFIFNFPNFLNLSFSPGATLIYIILWLITPEATSTSDKLEMKGEKVNLNSIKNTIQKDMEGFTDRAKDFGKEIQFINKLQITSQKEGRSMKFT